MNISSIKKVGRPKKYDKVSYWGMKLTQEGKEKIKILAEREKKPASTVIMELVEKALASLPIEPTKQKLTIAELRKLPKDEQNKIVEAQAKIGAKYFEFEEDFDDFDDN